MEPVYRCIAGIDVHKKMLAVVIRRPSGEQVEYEKRKFGTTRKEIEHLSAWLQARSVSEVVMESTAQYWRPVWYGLEPHFRLHLTHPLKTRAPRGRKSDFRDAQRLADRWSSGDLEEKLHSGIGAKGLALADPNAGTVEQETGRDPQSRGRAAGTRRNQTVGGGE